MKFGYFFSGFFLTLLSGQALRLLFPPKNISDVLILTFSAMIIGGGAIFCYLKVKEVGFVRYGTYWLLGASMAFLVYNLAGPLKEKLDYFWVLAVNSIFAYSMAISSKQN